MADDMKMRPGDRNSSQNHAHAVQFSWFYLILILGIVWMLFSQGARTPEN